jgi:hypothetical protein
VHSSHVPFRHSFPPQSALVQHDVAWHLPPQHLVPASVPQSESALHATHAPPVHKSPAAQSDTPQHDVF